MNPFVAQMSSICLEGGIGWCTGAFRDGCGQIALRRGERVEGASGSHISTPKVLAVAQKRVRSRPKMRLTVQKNGTVGRGIRVSGRGNVSFCQEGSPVWCTDGGDSVLT